MNTKGMKFLAVLAVIAMAFSAVAIAVPAQDSDAAYPATTTYTIAAAGTENSLLGDMDVSITGYSSDLTLELLGQTTLSGEEYSSGTGTVVTGYTDTTKVDDMGYNEGMYKGYATVYVKVPALGSYANVLGISLYQKNDSLKHLGGSLVNQTLNATAMTMTSYYNTNGPEGGSYQFGGYSGHTTDDYFAVLVPQDASKVTFTISFYDRPMMVNDKIVTSGYTVLGAVTYEIDFTDAVTFMDLDTIGPITDKLESTTGTWSYSSNTLVLNGLQANVSFYSDENALTVTLAGTNILRGESTGDASSCAVIHANTQALTMTLAEPATSASLKVIQKDYTGFGIAAKGMTIGSTTGAGLLTLDVSGGERGLYSDGVLTIQNSAVSAEGSCFGIRTTGNFTADYGASVTATVDGTGYHNGVGAKAIEGMYVDGTIVVGGTIGTAQTTEPSTVITSGLYSNTNTITINNTDSGVGGLLYVKGDYTQFDYENVYGINGWYNAASGYTTAATSISSAEGGTPGNVYVVDGALVYGVDVKSGTSTYVQKKITPENQGTQANLATALGTAAAGLECAIIDLSSQSTLETLDLSVLLEQGNISNLASLVILKGTSTKMASVSASDTITLGSTKITVIGLPLTGVFENGDSSMELSGLAGTSYSIQKGSVLLEGSITGGTIIISGDDNEIDGDLAGTLNVKAAEDAESASIEFLENFKISSGTLNLTGVEATFDGDVSNAGTIYFKTGTTLGDAAEITGGTLKFDDKINKDLTFNGGTISTDFATSKNLYLTGAVNFSGDVTVDGDYSNTGAVAITGTTSDPSVMTLKGTSTIAGNITLTTAANLVLSGTTNVAPGVTVKASAAYSAGKYNFVKNSGTLTVEGIIGDNSAKENENFGVLVNDGVLVIKHTDNDEGQVVYLINNKTVRLYGFIGVKAVVDFGVLVNDGTISVMDSAADIYAARSGTGTIDKSAVASDAYLTGDISTVQTPFTKWQRVIVNANTTLHSGAGIIVQGDLIVTDGITLTIENGAVLEARGTFANLTNNGIISVEGTKTQEASVEHPENGALFINGAEFVNNNTVNVVYDGTAVSPVNIKVAGSSIISNPGMITIGEGNVLKIDSATTSFENAGSLTIEGKIDAAAGVKIKNAGLVTINSVAEQENLLLSNSAATAIVVVSAVYGDLTINDASFKTSSSISGGDSIAVVVGATIRTNDTDATVGGFTITQGTFKNANNSNKVTPKMILNGAIELDTDYEGIKTDAAATAVTFTATGFVDVDTLLAVGEGTIFTLGAKTLMNVSGGMAIDEDATTAGAATSQIIVTGEIDSYDKALNSNILLNAAYYIQPKTSETAKCYVYTTFHNAIEAAESAGVTNVYVYGNVDNGVTDGILVTEKTDVPLGMNVRIQSGNLVVGKEVELTVPYDASYTTVITLASGATINVNGKLVFDNQAKGLKGSSASIVSEVVVISGTKYTYTTLAWAISDVGTEDAVLTLSGNTVIKNNTTIPSNITVDTNGHDFTVSDDVTLTIDGTLFLNGGNYTVSEDDAKIVLNGFITKESAMTYDGLAYPAGLYYTIEDAATYVITSIENAEVSALVADGKMVYRGDLVTNAIEFDADGEIEFTGTVKAKSMTTGSGAVVTFDDDAAIDAVSMGVSTIVFKEGALIDGAFSSLVGGIAFADAYAVKDTTLKVATASDVTTMSVAGKVSYVDEEEYEVVTTGAITVTADMAALEVASGTTTIGANVSIPAVLVNGTLAVNNGYTLTSDEMIIVNGTLAAKEATSTASKGSVVAKAIVAGMEFLADTSAAAVITGDVNTDYAYVANGSTIPETISKLAYSTVVYVELDAVMTVYGVSSESLEGIELIFDLGFSDPNAEFNGWVDEDDIPVLNPKIGSPTAIYADLDYDVYTVYILSDAGVKSISIDGKELIAEGNNVFVTENGIIGFKLSAGTYKVTYTLKTGYEGNAQLYTKTGTILKDNGFTISPGEDTTNIELQLNGTHKEVTPEPEPTPTPEKESEWNVTTILLLVLVILIAIMAVIVALRLNRN